MLLGLAYLAIINPYYFKYALHYKTSDWYLNTGYSPSDVCSDVGLFGEYHATIDYSNLKGNFGKIYNGLIIPKPEGSFTELDLVLVSELQIDIVEVKARGGAFSGHVLDDKWVQRIGSQRNELQNPVIQNQNHINFLYLYLYKQLKDSSSKLIDIDSFANDIYFALDADLYVENPLEAVRFTEPMKKLEHRSLPERYSPEEVKVITDILDALPKYTPEEKRQMFARREVQYRNGEFIHPVVYYPVKYVIYDGKSDFYSISTLCMDAETYQFYQGGDGLWRAVPNIIAAEKGHSCSTLQEATLLKKQLGW